jgi:hypothetical protein
MPVDALAARRYHGNAMSIRWSPRSLHQSATGDAGGLFDTVSRAGSAVSMARFTRGSGVTGCRLMERHSPPP